MTATDHELAEGFVERAEPDPDPDPLPTDFATIPQTDEKGRDWILMFDPGCLDGYIRSVSIEYLEDWR